MLYQLKDGRWIVQWRDKTKKSGYSRKYFGRGIEGERAAVEYEKSLGIREYTKRPVETKSPTFGELVDAYCLAKLARTEKSTQDNLKYKINGVYLPEFDTVKANSMNPARIDRFVKKRLNAGKKRTTIHRELSDIRAILNWAAAPERQHILVNPMAGYKLPERDDAIIYPATEEEINKILDKAAGHVQRAILTSYYSGLRPGMAELTYLQWSSIDWDRKTVTITSAKKRGPRIRVVPIHEEFWECLCQWYEEDIAWKNEFKAESVPEYIVHYRGQPVKRIIKAFNRAKTAAGIKRRLPPYAFRHTFATAILEDGGDLKTLSQMIGHSRTETTMKHYQHISKELSEKTIGKLPGLNRNLDK